MITPKIFYTLQCDRCKNVFEVSDEITALEDMSDIWDQAQDSDWIEREGKHYCPDCYSIGEEGWQILPDYPKSLFKLKNFLKSYVGYGDVIISERLEHFIVSVHLRTNEQLRKEYLEMIRLILTLESWEFEVIPVNGCSNSKLVIKIEKR